MKPELSDLVECINELAEAMKMAALPRELCIDLVNHVLYEQSHGRVDGKRGWACFTKKLITEREIRNLLIAHSATRISSFNKVNEPNCGGYMTKELCQKFELSLHGRLAVLQEVDQLDSWEQPNV